MLNKNALTSALLITLLMSPLNAVGRGPGDAPVPIDVIDHDTLAALPENDRSVADILKLVPGITVGDPNSPLSIRGVGAGNSKVLVNGVASSGSSRLGLEIDMTAETDGGLVFGSSIFVDRIEVLRDPEETVVNVVTSDRYNGFDLSNSWVLNDITRGLSNYWFTVESKKECDATNGSETPYWYFSSKHDYGMPKISMDGDLFRWGSQSGDNATERTDAERPGFGSSSIDTSPKTSTTETAPAAQSGAAPNVADPFDEYPYPPDYAFDFSQCSGEQKARVLELINDRDQARADSSYYMDYLRRPGQSAQDVAEDEANANEAIKTRDTKNEELRNFWQSCTNPQAAASNADTPDAEFSVAPGMRPKWHLELRIEYDATGDDDKPASKEPASGIGVGVYGYNFGLKYDLPFGDGSLRDIDFDAGAGGSRAFTDERGIARFENAIDLPRPRMQIDLTGATDGGLEFGSRFFGRDLGDDDWQIFADFDFKGQRSGPTIGLKYKYESVDSVYQEFVGDGNSDEGDDSLYFPELGDQVSKYGSGFFSFGDRSFQTYTFPELGGFKYDLLDKMPGQTYWANNDCGDAALPAEGGGGYLTAQQSPVKTVDDQWALERVGLSGDEPKLDEFAKSIVVGVIDTGIDWNHLDFAWDNLWRNEGEIPDNGIDDDQNGFVDDIIGWNFTGENNRPWDNDGHGTFVAGIIAATQGNDAGIDGINGNAKIMVLKALNNFGRTRASYVARAIVYGADNGAQILNLSVTGPGFPKIVQDAVNYAESRGVLVINAAGNRAEDIDAARQPPLQRVLTVAATGPDDKRAAFSNVGNAVDIAAPGIDIVSLRARATDFMFNSAETTYVREDAFLGQDRRYYRSTGTSFATPIVSGIASLVLANNPGLTPAELKRVLEQSARDVETPGRDRFTGFGIVDAKAALAADPAFYIHAAIPAVRPIEVDGQIFLQVIGVVDADQLSSATLEIGEGDSPEVWTSTGTVVSEKISGAPIGQIPAERFAAASTWTIRLVVEHQNGSKREARYVIDL